MFINVRVIVKSCTSYIIWKQNKPDFILFETLLACATIVHRPNHTLGMQLDVIISINLEILLVFHDSLDHTEWFADEFESRKGLGSGNEYFDCQNIVHNKTGAKYLVKQFEGVCLWLKKSFVIKALAELVHFVPPQCHDIVKFGYQINVRVGLQIISSATVTPNGVYWNIYYM